MFTMSNIQHLANRLKASDRDAFRIIFESYQEGIFRFLYLKTKDVQLAEDLLQEAFYKLWANRSKLDSEQSLKSYLYTIAEHLFLNHCRHQMVVQQYGQFRRGMTTAETPHFLLEEEEFRQQLESAINMLPEKVKEVFTMSRFEDLSYQEIADRQSISIKTVESHMVKALRLLR